MKKLQIWSADLVISVTVFSIVLIGVIFAWNYTAVQNAEQVEFNKMEDHALIISDVLIRTTGSPLNWNSSNVQVLGLASDENILNETKINQFINLSYEKIKQLLDISNYEFYFEMRHLNNTVIEIEPGKNLTKGIYPLNASIIIPIERYVLYNNKIAKLEFILWD